MPTFLAYVSTCIIILCALLSARRSDSSRAAVAAASFSQSLDSDFTFTLPAGRKECFYQTMRKDASLEIEYQVLDGAGLDVDFSLYSPSGNMLIADYRKSDGVHTVETEDGDYMFCFDNTFSAVSEKIIFFELILDNMEDLEGGDPDWKEYVHGTDMLDMKLEDIMDTINSVKARLGKSLQIQTVLRAFEARDRNLQESNYERVNLWSCTNLIVMVVVSGVQVYLLRSLFDDKRKSRT
ncbi:transmembrane emp24 domain-containing protein 5-like [Scleropages formosus]|uniref:Phosphatidylinositol glycan anchor biosynthesis, class C n=1 Tax=Scleropages formosus TaxID=113540 RepID=A0A8C9WEG5_SCLFO|nr:transmembrane emp24 domain-containing protein 5-like [Scleropages formosus]XP_029110405.1 transmembrane emp24 domain-containing protein 5-like [Scleropages formosus]